MGAAAYGGRGFKERARVSGEMSMGADSCRQQYNQASCQPRTPSSNASLPPTDTNPVGVQNCNRLPPPPPPPPLRPRHHPPALSAPLSCTTLLSASHHCTGHKASTPHLLASHHRPEHQTCAWLLSAHHGARVRHTTSAVISSRCPAVMNTTLRGTFAAAAHVLCAVVCLHRRGPADGICGVCGAIRHAISDQRPHVWGPIPSRYPHAAGHAEVSAIGGEDGHHCSLAAVHFFWIRFAGLHPSKLDLAVDSSSISVKPKRMPNAHHAYPVLGGGLWMGTVRG